jgi:hypothetical protein
VSTGFVVLVGVVGVVVDGLVVIVGGACGSMVIVVGTSGSTVIVVGVVDGLVVVGVVGACVPTGFVVVGARVSTGFVVLVGVVGVVVDGLVVVGVGGGCLSAGSVEVDIRMPPSGDRVQVPFSGHRFACSSCTVSPSSMCQLDSTEGSELEGSTHHLYHW